MNITGMDVYYASDLKKYGFIDDGTPFIGEVFYIEIENDNGDRWRLNHTFDGAAVIHYDEGNRFDDIRPQAISKCKRLIKRIKEAGKINLQEWHQSSPAYGSNAYVSYGQADDLWRERNNSDY